MEPLIDNGRKVDHMVSPGYVVLALIAGLLLLAFILGVAFIPDDTHEFF